MLTKTTNSQGNISCRDFFLALYFPVFSIIAVSHVTVFNSLNVISNFYSYCFQQRVDTPEVTELKDLHLDQLHAVILYRVV